MSFFDEDFNGASIVGHLIAIIAALAVSIARIDCAVDYHLHVRPSAVKEPER